MPPVPVISSRRRHRARAPRVIAPWMVFAASLALTLVLSWITASAASTRDQVRFERAALQARQRVVARLDIYIALLRSTAGLVGVDPGISREDFEAYVGRLRIRDNYPGAQGFGVSLRISPDSMALVEARLRREGIDDFRIRPDTTRAEYHAIIYLAPLDARNRAALGYDMFTEPVRREAMERARDGADAAMSGRVTLVQEITGRRQAGFLLYVPVYDDNVAPPLVAERRRQLVGFVHAPFRADDLFAGIFGRVMEPEVEMQLYDGPVPVDSALLHDSRRGMSIVRPSYAGLADTLSFDIAGRPWTMVVTPAPAFADGRRAPLAPIVALLGVIVSLALFALARARRRAVMAVAEARDLFGRVLEQAPVAICVLRGPDHVFEVANPPYRQLLPGDPIGRPVRDVMPHAGAHGFIETLDRVYASGEPLVGDDDGIARDPGGAVRGDGRHFNVLYYPFKRRDGGTDGVIVVAVDVTAEVQSRRDAEHARKEAEQANRAKSDFLAAMSHELRTPLNAISGYVQLVDMGVYGPVTPQQHGILARVKRSGSHLLSLINDVLNFAKLEAGRVEFEIGDVDLRAVASDVIHMVEPQLEARELACHLDLPTGLLVRADEEKLRQVLLNLLSNAVKFTEEGSVTIHASAPADRPGVRCLHVTDTGVGIPTDRHAAVFDPFVQVNRGLTQTTEGTGLGLAISRDLARAMGGDLTVQSQAGSGSTFTVSLPAVVAHPDEPAQQAPADADDADDSDRHGSAAAD